jgi:hypothetical protein
MLDKQTRRALKDTLRVLDFVRSTSTLERDARNVIFEHETRIQELLKAHDVKMIEAADGED